MSHTVSIAADIRTSLKPEGCPKPRRDDDVAVNIAGQGRSLLDGRGAMILCCALVLFAAGLRLWGLGSASLWADEFATWHVSRMPLGESLRWGPELTKPPLYQLILRLLTDDPLPPEWLLRLPAAIAGALAVGAIFLLGRMEGTAGHGRAPPVGRIVVGAAGGLLLACRRLQFDYSQEARSDSLLVLASTASDGCTMASAPRDAKRESPRIAARVVTFAERRSSNHRETRR